MRKALIGVLVAASFALAGGGCFKGEFPNCAVTCATSGDCPSGLTCSAQGVCSTGGDCQGALEDALTVDADLTRPQRLTVTKTGDGAITSDPGGIDCGTTCTAEFDPLTTVTLTAVPGANQVFDGFTGACAGMDSPCTVTMDNDKTVGARFLAHGARIWHAQIGFAGDDTAGKSVEVDAAGNVITAVFAQDSAVDVNSLVFTKYAHDDGAVVWTKKYDFGSVGAYLGGIDTDADGNVYVCSRLQAGGAVVIDGKTVTGDIFGNVLVLRLAAATGSVDWAKSFGGTAQEDCAGIAIAGNQYFITGYSSSMPATFDSASITGATNGAFLARGAIATGTAAQAIPLAANYSINDIAVNGNVVAVAGIVRNNGTAGSCNVTVSGTGGEAFVAQFSQSGLSCQWANTEGSITNNEAASAAAIAPVPGGGWQVTGSYQGSVNFTSGAATPNAGGFDAYILRYSSTGAYVYAFGYGSTGADVGNSVAVLPTGAVLWGGSFSTTIQFGGTTLTGGASDIFVTRMSAGNTPQHQWAAKYGALNTSDLLYDLDVDPAGNVFAVGTFTGMTDIGGQQLTSQGTDAWVGAFVR